MKKSTTVIAMMGCLLLSAVSSFAQDKKTNFSNLLENYYDIKNALIEGNTAGASKSAASFISSINGVNVNSLPANEQAALKTTQAKMRSDANNIATGKDLAKQRLAFQTLSDNMITLTKSGKATGPVYIDYCPMKKAYWLSSEKDIRNPYYGNAMLTCGKITTTLQ